MDFESEFLQVMPGLAPFPAGSGPKALSSWSEGHVWVSPEMHGAITGAFKNQIDWRRGMKRSLNHCV